MHRHISRAALAALAATLLTATASAQPLAMTEPSSFPSSIFQQVMPQPEAVPDEDAGLPQSGPDETQVPAQLHRQIVSYPSREAPGTIVIDTPHAFLYYVLPGSRAIRYGVGVGREGFAWSGVRSIGRKQEWPDWHPPAEMIARQPYLPRFMAGGPGNPLGARAMYLAGTLYRIHGTSEPSTIGRHVSSGCIRMLNSDVEDLYNRVAVGTKVVVLPDARRAIGSTVAHAPRPAPQHLSSVQYSNDDAPRPAAAMSRASSRPFTLGAPSQLY